jgi:hypothetical protein
LIEPDLSLFGLPLPAFAAFDRFMGSHLEPLPRLLAWGALMAVLVMLLYKLISPQHRLARIRTEAASARQRVAEFDGEFNELMPLIRNSFRLSMLQIAWILFPALLASLPLVSCLIWLDLAYGYRAPAPAQPVHLAVWPRSERIQSVPETAVDRRSSGWHVSWPRADDAVTLFDRHGEALAILNGVPAGNVIEPYRWWNALVGNPMGYLPADSPVQRLEFRFYPAEIIGSGPPWIRGWQTPFFGALVALSLLFKVVYRIE